MPRCQGSSLSDVPDVISFPFNPVNGSTYLTEGERTRIPIFHQLVRQRGDERRVVVGLQWRVAWREEAGIAYWYGDCKDK